MLVIEYHTWRSQALFPIGMTWQNENVSLSNSWLDRFPNCHELPVANGLGYLTNIRHMHTSNLISSWTHVVFILNVLQAMCNFHELCILIPINVITPLLLIDHCHPQWCILLVWRWRFWWEACKIFGEACKISGETWKIFGETSNAEDWRCVPVPQHSQGDHHSDYMADDDFTMITRVMLMIPSRATTTWFWRRVSPTRTSMATATLTSSISSLRWTALPSHQLDGRKKYKTSHHQLSDETVWLLWTMKMFLFQPFNTYHHGLPADDLLVHICIPL